MTRPQVAVYIATSVDGFIAREDGGIDWLQSVARPGEDCGYAEFMAAIEALVIGRVTWETVDAFEAWPFDGKRVVVLSHRAIDAGHGEQRHDRALAPLLDRLSAEGVRRVYLDGGVAIRQGLSEGLVDELTLSVIPVVPAVDGRSSAAASRRSTCAASGRAPSSRAASSRATCDADRRSHPSAAAEPPTGSSRPAADRPRGRSRRGARRARDGTAMEPMDFMARLAALVPPPQHPLVRYHGVFAPHSPWRAAVVPGPRPQELERRMKACAAKAMAMSAAAAGVVSAAGARAATTDAGIWDEGDGGRPATVTEATRTKAIARGSSRMDWATLRHRVWDVDALKCPRCEGPMKFIATITDRAVIVRILTHLGLPAAEVVAAPARHWDDTS